MSTNREILTLQFGNYSNYIGAHWWNIQEFGFNYDPETESDESSELNHDVLYREGLDLRGKTTFTPRLLSVDLDGSLGHLSQYGELYEDLSDIVNYGAGAHTSSSHADKLTFEKENILWDSKQIEVIQKEPTNKLDFQKDINDANIDINSKEYNLPENVTNWTDFLYTRYHPRSLNIIKEFKLSNEKESFDTFTNGNRIWDTEQFTEDFSDRIRLYIEESNNCQGFQTIFDCTNGFSGLSIKCLQHLNDEYSKINFAVPVFTPKSILFENADQAMTDSIRVVNTIFTYASLFEHCSLFVPLSMHQRAWRQLGTPRLLPNINYDVTNLYQSSAILSSFLDSISLCYRVKYPTHSGHLSAFCNGLSNNGRKLAAAAISFPFPMRSDSDFIDCLDNFEDNFLTQLSPNTKISTDYMIQTVCIRGIPQERLKKPLHLAKEQMKMAGYKCNSVSEMLQLYFQCTNHASVSNVMAISKSMPIKKPFPLEMLDKRLNINGFITDQENDTNEKCLGIPTVASIQSSSDLSYTLETLHREASRIKIQKLHRFTETGMETDDYTEILENLLQYKDNYEDNMQL